MHCRSGLPLFTFAILVLALTAFAGGCHDKESSDKDDSKATSAPDKTVPPHVERPPAEKTGSSNKAEKSVALVHDPSHPPIDCPLRKQGIDPSNMKPFEEVEKYINFLEREDRAIWQKPDEIVAALRLSGDETVVDLGAVSG